jgi:hypothetical protein
MRLISETKALERLGELKQRFKQAVEPYEQAAKSCLACDTPGACCLDEHFVNVRISKLEAVAIDRLLKTLPREMSVRVEERRKKTIEKFGLTADSDDYARTYACPLFEPSVGCLVHDTAKPLPCIHHACYARPQDMPPAELLSDAEIEIDALSRRTYLSSQPLLPIPVALERRS